jgi:G3E family GTPase
VKFKNGCLVGLTNEGASEEAYKIAKDKQFDHIIVECDGATEPMAIAETFTFEISEVE